MKPFFREYWLIAVLPTNLYAGDNTKATNDIPWNLFLIILTGIIGYIVGAVKAFREEKQKAYGEIIPPILKMAYDPDDLVDEKEYIKALAKLWLYGSKKVTKKMEHVLKILHTPGKEGLTKALQEAVVEMRKDIQVVWWPWQNLKPENVGHLYTKIAGTSRKDNKNT